MRALRTTLALALASTAGALAVVTPAYADHGGLTVTGLTQNHRLVTFKAATPGTLLSTVAVTGLADGDTLEAIDFRPATGGLYGVSTSVAGAKLYLIDPVSGAASRVGTTVYAIAGDVSIDFNPTVDRLRVVSSDTTDLRVNPNNGALAATDGNLAYATGDRSFGTTPAVGGVAYLNNDNDCLNVAPATSCTKADGTPGTGTTLFDIDAATNNLVSQVPPNSGTLNTIGALPAATKAGKTGLDIYTRTTNGVNWAFASLWDKGTTTFYELDLSTGGAAATPLGAGKTIGGKPAVIDIALATAQSGF